MQTIIDEGVFAKGLDEPHIIVLTPDTQVVVDVFKELKAKFQDKKLKSGVEVRI